MPCTSCMVDYSRSKKEVFFNFNLLKLIFFLKFGCAKCKFSFCRKCLPYDVVILSISSQPVPVCSNCYSLLNQQQQQNVESSKDKNREMPSNINCWDGEDLPPPSLRPLFSSNKTSKQNLKSNKNEWKELEERLERLNEPIESVKEEKKKIQGIGQLEERLAALRGVDVDIIRRPGLLIVNQDESQPNVDDERYENEVLRLLNEVG
uniref:FYVE-type domain-containing protein n=1 Tax=Meloidogyne floridensis TaxID=298350 RepID=A0A915NQB8_9BILA